MQLTVEPDSAGQRLDALLADSLGSRSRAARLIEAGAVTVDGRARPKRHVVAAGEVVVVDDAIEQPEAPADLGAAVTFAVPYEDEHLLVVDKPAGLVVHPAKGHLTGTLSQALERTNPAHRPGDDGWRAGLVHRLDRETSGLLVVAKSDAVHAALKEALQRRDVTREYAALVEGRPPARTGTIDAPIGRDRRVRTRHSTDTDNPREARTHFAIAEAFDYYTLLTVTLETGRTHQIRVHLLAIDHPVAGDPEYGHADRLGLTRQFLHAQRLAFTHPVTGAAIAVESPLPPELEQALDRARAGER
ncbi:Ribosomal large subunit pseudouridine synthase D [Baekduia alba]|uniref:RluA family pseudouridine synthase n=1 Tax=Baekduia alba TaxID=2997333 RepID=UPI002340DA27|nr:RluA family pseudouridine synthase [Baekduia alba]WCB93937.1 Ribosomal large subunit pseudouridine synthase D [Baekduia alba]